MHILILLLILIVIVIVIAIGVYIYIYIYIYILYILYHDINTSAININKLKINSLLIAQFNIDINCL